ncbi:O-antigen ligase family protein [bacterium]|nr:O-antigen ligase family protein [bacterium]
MRNIFLLIALAFCVYFGSSLWTFTDPASFKVVANYIPLAVMLLTLVIGLIHLRFALTLAIIFIFFCGNPAIFDQMLYRVCSLCGWETFLSDSVSVGPSMKFFQLAPISYECIILALFAAWALTRFFGNPELDFEVNRARTARQMHLPVFIFGLTAVIAGLYAIVCSGNVFMPGFFPKVQHILCSFPFPFFQKMGAQNLTALRNAALVIELIALYTVVVNEVWSEKHIKFYLGILLLLAIGSVFVGVFQRVTLTGFSNYVYRYTREVHSTFGDPNSWSVFLLAILPIGLGLLFAGIVPAFCGLAVIILILLGIALSGSKVMLLFAALALAIFFVATLVKTFRGGKIIPPVFVGLLIALSVIFAVGSYVNVDKEELLSTKNNSKNSAYSAQKDVDNPSGKPVGLFHNSLATSVANQLDSFREAIVKDDPEFVKISKTQSSFEADLYARTNHKSADWLTVWNYLRPANGNWDVLALGCGCGNFKKAYRSYQPKYVKESRGGASNFLLQVLVEQGVFGFAALLIVTILTICVAFGCVDHTVSPRTSRVLAWMFTFLTLGCFFENAFTQYQIASLYWFLCGLIMVNAATTNRDFQPSFKVLYGLILLLLLAGAVAVFWPKLTEERFEKRSFDSAVLRMESSLGESLTEEQLETVYAKSEFNFHYNQVGRWSDKQSFLIVRPEKGKSVMRLDVACGQPDVSPEQPFEVEVLAENETAMRFSFTNSCLKTLEFNLNSSTQLRALCQERDYIVVCVKNSRTFVPAEQFPALSNMTYNVGCFVGKLTWMEKQTLPSEEMKEIPEDEEPREEVPEVRETAPVAEVKEEKPKEIDVPKETIFGDKVNEEELDETLKEMSNFELELPQ